MHQEEDEEGVEGTLKIEGQVGAGATALGEATEEEEEEEGMVTVGEDLSRVRARGNRASRVLLWVA